MKVRHLLATLLSGILAAGCCIHQFPDEVTPPTPPAPGADHSFRLKFETSLPLLGEYIYETGAARPFSRARGPEEAQNPHHIRYTVNAYPLSKGEPSRSSDTTMIFTREVEQGLDTTFDVNMPAGEYRFIVWTDYVDKGSMSDKYYRTDDFSEVILAEKGRHYGSNEWRDAFYGSAEVSVGGNAGGETVIQMERPMARYTFVSTDLASFLENESRRKREESVAAGEPSRAPSLDDYIVRFVYTRYMPCSFNLFTGRPADSWTGVEYESNLRRLSEDEAELGFDYVFVNGTQTAVTVGVEVLDSNHNLLARIPAFDVPLKRSHHTIVRGKFLTTKAGGEMGIDPDYDGEFNIEIK